MKAAPRRIVIALLIAASSSSVEAIDAPHSASEPWVPKDGDYYQSDGTPAPTVLPNHPLSLGELIDMALQTSPDTRGTWQAAVQAAATVGRATGAFLPQVNANIGFSKQYQKTDGQLEAGPYIFPQLQIVNSPSVFVSPGANLTWMLWDFGASKAGLDAAKAALAASNLQHNRALQGVVHQVQSAYFAYDSARGAYEAADAGSALAEANLEEAMLKRRSGLAGLAEELQARQSEGRARLQREQLRDGVEQAKAQLLVMAGIPPSESVQIAEQSAGPESPPAVAAVGALLAQTMATRPDIAARYAKIAALEDQLKRTQRMFLPSVAFTAGVNRTRGVQATLSSQGVANPTAIQQNQITQYRAVGYIETAQAGISVNADITGLVTYNRVMEAKRAEVDAARAQLRQAIVTAEHEVWMDVDACKSAREQFDEARDLLKVSEKTYSVVERAHRNGLQSELDLLQARQALTEARYSLVDARARMFTSAADLAYATGQTPMGSASNGG